MKRTSDADWPTIMRLKKEDIFQQQDVGSQHFVQAEQRLISLDPENNTICEILSKLKSLVSSTNKFSVYHSIC